jgi:hypothetical protein
MLINLKKLELSVSDKVFNLQLAEQRLAVATLFFSTLDKLAYSKSLCAKIESLNESLDKMFSSQSVYTVTTVTREQELQMRYAHRDAILAQIQSVIDSLKKVLDNALDANSESSLKLANVVQSALDVIQNFYDAVKNFDVDSNLQKVVNQADAKVDKVETKKRDKTVNTKIDTTEDILAEYF